MFAVGGFNVLAICDQMGWAHAKARADAGSLLGLAWSPDGAQLAAAGGAGGVLLARPVGARAEGPHAAALLADEARVEVHDAAGEAHEVLDFREPVVRMAMGEGAGGRGGRGPGELAGRGRALRGGGWGTRRAAWSVQARRQGRANPAYCRCCAPCSSPPAHLPQATAT
jgi:hypothetical protein